MAAPVGSSSGKTMSAQPAAPVVPAVPAAPTTTPSPSLSFKGWLFSKWLVKNKAALKLLLVVFFAWLTATFATIASPELKALAVGGVTFISKFGIDLLDYWLTEQPEIPNQQPSA